MIRIGSVIFGLIACCQILMSQDNPTNPFDIKGRRNITIVDSTVNVEKTLHALTELPNSTTNSELGPLHADSATTNEDTFGTAFEIPFIAGDLPIGDEQTLDSVVQGISDGTTTAADETDDDAKASGLEELTDLTSNMTDLRMSRQNILLIFTILSLLLLAALLTINRAMVNKSYRAIANDNYLRFLFREYTSMPWLYWLFYFLFILNMGFFLYLLVAYFDLSYESSLPVLLACLGIVVIVYVGKHLILSILGRSFPIEKETHLYGFVTMLVNSLLGLVLVLVNLLVAFGPDLVSGIAVWVGICAVSIMYLFRLLKGLFISGRFIAHYQFHFFLYLCSAEIAPLLILSKIALVNFGQH